jgi:hypothetical protein
MASTEDTEFPVFFPVSREFGWRKVRTGLRPPPSSPFNSLSKGCSSKNIDFARYCGVLHGPAILDCGTMSVW